jgi:predicted Zn-dependent protease
VYRVDARPDGTFTLGVPLAYNITKGELGDPFYGIKISGNLFDFLKKMTALEKESTFQISHCSKGTGGSVQNVKVGAVVPAAAFTEWNVECDVP